MSELTWRDAVAFSHNFATAKPNIGLTEKQHILGLCNFLTVNGARMDAARDISEKLEALLDALDANGSCQYETLREDARDALAKARGES